jgi:hypothetical protein
MAERWVEKHAISQLQAALTVSVILAENLKISHFLAGAKFRRHAVNLVTIILLANEKARRRESKFRV